MQEEEDGQISFYVLASKKKIPKQAHAKTRLTINFF